MNFLKRFKFTTLVVILFVVVSCEQKESALGASIVGGDPFITDKAVFEVSAVNTKISAVQTNQLPVYQLGVFNDPVYGKTVATITSQVQLAGSNPTFGETKESEELTNDNKIVEDEKIDSVVVYIPFFVEPITSSETTEANIAKEFQIDSIYGDTTQTFSLKIQESTYFLRDLDPNSNFEESQQYFSNQQFSPDFTDKVFFEESNLRISNKETLIFKSEDDESTEDIDERTTVERRLNPGIRVRLNEIGETFFQDKLLNKEGSSELVSASNFKNFIRGIHLSVEPSSEELLFLINLLQAKVEVYYQYDAKEDDEIVEKHSMYTLSLLAGNANNFIGNAVNTYVNEDYPEEIVNALNDTDSNASRLYLKGGSGSYATLSLFKNAEEEIRQIKANNWIINEANLTLYVDQNATGSVGEEPPRLYLFNADTNAPIYNILTETNVSESPLGVFLNYDGILQKTGDRGVKYKLNITDHINNIVLRDSVNAPLGLQVTADIRISGASDAILDGGEVQELPASSNLTPLGTVLYGSNVPPAEQSKKLKLEIFYTKTD